VLGNEFENSIIEGRLLVDKLRNRVKHLYIKSNARCLLASMLRNVLVEPFLSPTNSSDFDAMRNEMIRHGSTDASGSADQEYMFVRKRHDEDYDVSGVDY
jgi:hypothetical protein